MPKITNEFARYTKADDTYKHRIVAASYGEVGTGKTSFWLGAPGPIVVQTLDQGLEGVVEAFTKTKDIYIANYDMGQTVGEGFTHELAVEARDKFISDFEHALGVARTIIWDRESDMWSLFSYAEHGTTDKYGAANPKDWDKLKGTIRRLIAMAKATDVNFGVIQGMRDEWSKGKMGKTGNRIRNGMDDVDALVHVNIEHVRVDGKFAINIGKSRGPGSGEVQDKSFDSMTFAEFGQILFPDSEESSWV
jgi:hypothetical protein